MPTQTTACHTTDGSVHDPDEPRELTFVDLDTFEASLWADF